MTLDEVATVLREYGSAIRGDWGSIDGRSEQITISEFASVITSPERSTIQDLRANADICPYGQGHWTEYCGPDCGASI